MIVLSTEELGLLRAGAAKLEVACVLLDDTVPNRLCWPRHAALRVESDAASVVVRVPCRPAGRDLNVQGRDPAAVVQMPPDLLSLKMNVVCAAYDPRRFAIMARTTCSRTTKEVLADVQPAGGFADAVESVVARFRLDEADGMVLDKMTLSLVDPISGGRVRDPVRFPKCADAAVFDLSSFVQLAKTSGRWTCPRCSAGGPASSLRRDAYVAAILAALSVSALRLRNVAVVEVDSTGAWRPRLSPSGSFGRWYTPAETQAAVASGEGLPYDGSVGDEGAAGPCIVLDA